MYGSIKNTRTDKKKCIKKTGISKDKKISKEILYKMKGENKKESILEFLYKTRMDNAIEEAIEKDNKYQKANKKAHSKIGKIKRRKFNSAQWKLVDEALSVSNEIGAEYGRVTYYQGFKDAINLLAEIHLSL